MGSIHIRCTPIKGRGPARTKRRGWVAGECRPRDVTCVSCRLAARLSGGDSLLPSMRSRFAVQGLRPTCDVHRAVRTAPRVRLERDRRFPTRRPVADALETTTEYVVDEGTYRNSGSETATANAMPLPAKTPHVRQVPETASFAASHRVTARAFAPHWNDKTGAPGYGSASWPLGPRARERPAFRCLPENLA